MQSKPRNLIVADLSVSNTNHTDSDTADGYNSAEGYSSDNALGIVEANVLQKRTIGLFGAVSLIVNKIIGAGYATRLFLLGNVKLMDAVSFRPLAQSSSFPEVSEWH